MMISTKPICGACGTGNPLDSDYCLECGVRLTQRDTLAEGMELYLEHDVSDCEHSVVVENVQCKCVRCIKCDKRTETCFKHSPKFDYALPTHKKNPLDHLREPLSELEKKTPFPIEKKLDFKSMQLPDWEFGKEKQVEETFKEDFKKWQNDPCYVPIMSGQNTKIEFIPLEPYSAIIERDVQKGIGKPDINTRRGPKPDKSYIGKIPKQVPPKPKIGEIKHDVIKPHNNNVYIFAFPLLFLYVIFLYTLMKS